MGATYSVVFNSETSKVELHDFEGTDGITPYSRGEVVEFIPNQKLQVETRLLSAPEYLFVSTMELSQDQKKLTITDVTINLEKGGEPRQNTSISQDFNSGFLVKVY